MEKKQLRVLVFGSSGMHLMSTAIVKALSPFVSVKIVDWKYKQIPGKARYTFLRIVYRPFECIYWTLRIFKEIRKFHADLIIAEYGYTTGLIGTIAATMSRKKCVIYSVGSDLKKDPESLLGVNLVSWELRNSSGTICVSKDLENIAKMLGAKNTIAIPPPIDFPDFDEKVFREDWEVISVAALEQVKALPYLIRAMKRLNDNKLAIIGDGPERENLEALSLNLGLNSRVFFLGQVDHSMVWDFLQRAKVFVLPSVSEGTPRAIIEAMACGLPIVATKVGGVPEVITNDVNGFLVPPQDEDALAEAIENLLKDANLRKRISNENREKAKKYDMRIIGQRMYDYLRSIV
ncbi:MAG: glycosyltransferase [Candidatus Bathyarchaeota archaeon]|jgi:glycosyltransferase involved in cell wall biosynthesis